MKSIFNLLPVLFFLVINVHAANAAPKGSGLLLTMPPILAAQHQPPAQDFVTILQDAFDNQQSDIQVQGEGVVTRLLSDDLTGSRHQRFILRISPKQTVLIAHNIDIADKILGLQIDDTVEFYGEYEWNSLGGVIHWTHHDPDGYHIDGWLKYAGKTYQ